MLISGYPSNFTEEDFVKLIGPETIRKVVFKQKYSEVTFKSVKLAQTCLLIDGVAVGKGKKLSVKPLPTETQAE